MLFLVIIAPMVYRRFIVPVYVISSPNREGKALFLGGEGIQE